MGLILLVGCGGGSDNSSVTSNSNDNNITTNPPVNENNDSKNIVLQGNFSSEYYGKWLRVDTKEELNIISTTVIDNYDIVSKNLIKVTKDDTTYYLMRAGLSDIVVKGTLNSISNDASHASARRSISRIAGVNVILQNILDSHIKSDVQTDDAGNFETSSLPSGEYNLSIGDKAISSITISKPIEDIGTYKLTGDNLHNFKAELILDDEFLYADEKVHTGKIRIHNISNQIGYGLFYTLTLNDSDVKSFNYDLVKGSIKPKEYADIPIQISFNQIAKNSKSVSVDVTIGDAKNNKWKDSFKFTLYKGYFDVNIATEENIVKGYIIMPITHKVKNVAINGYGSIRLPLVSDEEYHLLLSNPSFENETAYSLGINSAIKSFKNFNYTPAHEPNDTEVLATGIVLNSSIVSYLNATDLDYWKISLPESEYLFDFSLGEFHVVNANLGEMVTSNAITITDKLTQGNSISAEINNGTLVINGVDTNSTIATLKTGDTLAIKLKAPLNVGGVETSTLLIGQNSLVFKIVIDQKAPVFISPTFFTLTAENNVTVGNIKATDEHHIIYNIKDGNDSNLFTIDSSSGKLTFNSLPDYEVNFTYNLSVIATDILNNATVQDVSVVYKRYTRNDIGIVKDNYTGYMWQDNVIKSAPFDVAVSYCNGLSLGGYEDWTLPSLEILSTIADVSRSDPAISPIFENIGAYDQGYIPYYASPVHTSSGIASWAWVINFINAKVYGKSIEENAYIRCVRSKQ